MNRYLKIIFFIAISKFSFSLDVVGGYISWKCNGSGRYFFELNLYRDCSGGDIENNAEIIKVWNHPTVSSITVNFNSRVSLTPTCTEVSGSSPQLSCGTGANAGNGIGTIEKLIYVSDVLDLDGLPPPEGWSFTFETLNRKASISNLLTPSLYGMTLTASMFENSPVQANCMDNSPKILNDLNFIACNSDNYSFVQLITDDDFDQLSYRLSSPLKNIVSGAFQQGINPLPVDYAPNYSNLLPTPSVLSNASNTDLSINPSNGDLTFKTVSNGEYVVKFEVDSHRNGKKNATIGIEYTVFVVSCDNSNTSPDVTGPFVGLFDYEATAGEIVTFNIASTDTELLQDGSLQTNIITPNGTMFGSNFSNSSGGCLIQPCAVLNPLPLIANNQGSNVNFSWETSCNHLRNQYGNEFDSLAFDFVFKFQDNYCQIPKTTYKRVTIHVETKTEIEPALVDCIQVLQNGDLLVTRTDPVNTNNVPVFFELNCIQTGSINLMPTSTFTLPSTGNIQDFFIRTVSGNPCSIAQNSDTVRNIVLAISPNPDFSVATLTWNSPYSSSIDKEGNYSIMREFPTGVWTEIALIDYGTNHYNDTVDICNAFINYQVIFNKIGCSFFSNIVGAQLQDGNIPDLPEVYTISIDPITENVIITWNENPKKDTYGYIIYTRDENNFSIDIDTVYGRTNTTVEYDFDTDLGPLTFTVAAFDSCLTDLGTFYSTTGKGLEHTTVFLTNTYDICAKTIELTWTPYIGWDSIKEYEILMKVDGSTYSIIGVTTSNSFTVPIEILRTYDFVVMAKDTSLFLQSYSNRSSRFSLSPTKPEFHYTKSVSVESEQNVVNHYIENNSGVKDIIIQRKNDENVFEDLVTLTVSSEQIQYIDTDVQPSAKNYTYQAILIDSCGNYSDTSNISTTMLLKVVPDNLNMVNFLNWTAYKGFNGSILYYNIYRGFEGQFTAFPFAKVPANHLYFYDTISDQINFNGQICYYVEAYESMNIYQFNDSCKSNVACSVFDPLIFIPNTFSPNEDEFNQFFKPELSLKEVSNFDLMIMNRWGEKVFESQNNSIGWDGKNSFTNQSSPQGTYLYILKVKNGDNQEILRKGYVNLIR
jgi:gliding motility-associated-like protein